MTRDQLQVFFLLKIEGVIKKICQNAFGDYETTMVVGYSRLDQNEVANTNPIQDRSDETEETLP